jgi:hypothetical protein
MGHRWHIPLFLFVELPELDVSGAALDGVLLMIVRTMNVSETCARGNSTQAPPFKVKGPLYWIPRGDPGEEEKLESLLRNAFVAPVTAFFRQGPHAARSKTIWPKADT